ncbi:TetR/AcrR family transcriptional regulator [Pseudofrankia saprophytica]|uniref:TetR/AcrR family transcriptional regulator n=1 Tax=Pseudofrankia saprophytica TaxID=298655 RepID=UPI0012FF54B2|nr:TetR/AcrR family transcriptional regulator [Pseudofrankia saprophytica]
MATERVHERRLSMEERREQVLTAAVAEFAENGYHAARTAAIAARAGISQPYIYALFENKKVLFLACQDQVHERIRGVFAAALRPAESPAESLRLLGRAYQVLLADEDLMRCRMQGFAAAADPEIRAHVHRCFVELFDAVKEMTGADQEQVARFFATGMLLTIGVTIDLPRSYAFAPPAH